MNPQRLNLCYIFLQEAEKIAHNVRQHAGKHIPLKSTWCRPATLLSEYSVLTRKSQYL